MKKVQPHYTNSDLASLFPNKFDSSVLTIAKDKK